MSEKKASGIFYAGGAMLAVLAGLWFLLSNRGAAVAASVIVGILIAAAGFRAHLWARRRSLSQQLWVLGGGIPVRLLIFAGAIYLFHYRWNWPLASVLLSLITTYLAGSLAEVIILSRISDLPMGSPAEEIHG